MRIVNDERLREIVRARLTKGDAFRGGDYKSRQNKVEAKLASMTRREIFNTYKHYVYDLRP